MRPTRQITPARGRGVLPRLRGGARLRLRDRADRAPGRDRAPRADGAAGPGLRCGRRPDHAHSPTRCRWLVVLAALFAWGWSLGRRREALAAVALVAGANLAGLILKVALAHPRYHPHSGRRPVGAEAFPSGHATSAMSIALAAVLVAPARLRVGVAAGAAAYVIAVSTVAAGARLALPERRAGRVAGRLRLLLRRGRRGPRRRAAGRAGAAAQRVRLALSPGLGGAGVAVLAARGPDRLVPAPTTCSRSRACTRRRPRPRSPSWRSRPASSRAPR